MKQNKKSRILVFIDWYSPGYKAGGPVRSMVNLTAHLAGDFDFFIATRNTEYGEDVAYDSVTPDCWSNLSPGVKVWYSTSGTPSLKLWKQLIVEIKPDVIYINGIYSPKFSILPLIAARSLKCDKIVVAPRGMLATSAVRVKGWKKRLFLGVSKWMNLYKKTLWHATNQKEADQIVDRLSVHRACIYQAPNLPRVGGKGIAQSVKEEMKLRLCSLARVAPEKNTLYAIQCLLSVEASCKIVLDLYGQIYDSNYWQLCEKEIAKLPTHIEVNYCGVTDSEFIPELLKEYNALLLPSRGENFGHVILESFMAGRPVVISNQTPWRNLSKTKSGWDLPLADMKGFKTVLESLAAMSQKEYDKWCNGAWELGQSVANDREVVELYKEMLGG